MNIVLSFLTQHWQRLGLEELGPASQLSCVMATPRFRASSHIIFFILRAKQTLPILVAKSPRLTGDHARLAREAHNLKLVHAARTEGFCSIPRLVAYEDYAGQRLLVETALAGETMSARLRRESSEPYVQQVTNWLIELHRATAVPSTTDPQWYDRLIGRLLQQFGEVLPLSTTELQLVEQTESLIAPLRNREIPLVFEHGDLGPLNILLSTKGGMGVVDWELAEPCGLPAADLFFLLTLASPAWRHAKGSSDYESAFHQTFFGSAAWARPYIVRYAEQMQLSAELLTPLFVLSWSRYVTNLVTRLHDFEATQSVLGNETTDWLRSNRYYALWRHAVEHINELCWFN